MRSIHRRYTYANEPQPQDIPAEPSSPAQSNKANNTDMPFFPMMKPVDRQGNVISFYTDFNADSALLFNRELNNAIIDSKLISVSYGIEPPPIYVKINSFGGEIFSAFAMIDNIIKSPVKIITVTEGVSFSCGSLLLCAGHERHMTENSLALLHQLSTFQEGTFEQLSDQNSNIKLVMNMLKEFYKKRTKIPVKKLDELLKRDLYLTAKECLHLGIIDKII